MMSNSWSILKNDIRNKPRLSKLPSTGQAFVDDLGELLFHSHELVLGKDAETREPGDDRVEEPPLVLLQCRLFEVVLAAGLDVVDNLSVGSAYCDPTAIIRESTVLP